MTSMIQILWWRYTKNLKDISKGINFTPTTYTHTFSILCALRTLTAFSLSSRSSLRRWWSVQLSCMSVTELLLLSFSHDLRVSASFGLDDVLFSGASGGRDNESDLSIPRTSSSGTRDPKNRCNLASLSLFRLLSSSACSSGVRFSRRDGEDNEKAVSLRLRFLWPEMIEEMSATSSSSERSMKEAGEPNEARPTSCSCWDGSLGIVSRGKLNSSGLRATE